jgi:hypothetical protein
MKYEQALLQWLEAHKAKRKGRGERERRISKGLGHGELRFLEQVWWPMTQSFDFLHPEYEVYDFRDGSRFVDFVYIRNQVRIAIEIDGFGPHLRNISRWQYSDQHRRQNDLLMDSWSLLRFTYDHIEEQPRYCQQAIQQMLGKWLGESKSEGNLDYVEKEIIRLLIRQAGQIVPLDVCKHLGVEAQTARKLLKGLASKGIIEAHGGAERIRSYKLIHRDRLDL